MAGALAAALGAFGIVAATAGTAQASPASVTGGHLDWGVKQSFRNYITGPIAHGTITTSAGATKNADGTFRFPAAQGTVDADADTASIRYTGTVQFTGHDSGSGPQLSMTVSDIRITLDTGGGGTLVADVISKSLQSGELETYDDVEFADLDASGADLVDQAGTVSAGGIGATLTEDGVPAFANFYPAGTALDPMSFAVTTQPPTIWEPAVQASRTSGLDPDGETVTVTGGGFDPSANTGTRPPLAGSPTGIYVVFAKIGDPWRPSQGAPSTARTVLDQKWVLPAASRTVLDPQGTNPDLVELAEDGTFGVTLDVAQLTEGAADCATDTCAVITYAAGGAVNADHEFALPLTFGSDAGGTPAPTGTTSEPGGVAEARLEWGVKESFRSYIRSPVAHGRWTLDGVSDNGGAGPFRWDDLRSGTFDPDSGGLLAFAGSVRFTGHDQGSGPLLDLTISQPQVEVGRGTATLLLDVRSKGMQNPDDIIELDDAAFAELNLAAGTRTDRDGVLTYTDVPATLTAEGARGFAGFYPAGTQLDPVTISIAQEDGALPPAGTAVKPRAHLASTGAQPWPLTLTGTALLLLGGTLLATQRRRFRRPSVEHQVVASHVRR